MEPKQPKKGTKMGKSQRSSGQKPGQFIEGLWGQVLNHAFDKLVILDPRGASWETVLIN